MSLEFRNRCTPDVACASHNAAFLCLNAIPPQKKTLYCPDMYLVPLVGEVGFRVSDTPVRTAR
ncbi:hypothetical protein PUN4_230039 [Paraburkholderia unamae]|nr:hypothetical protein PUN4_230039 [Paraburkholderia unamae]